MMKKRSRTTGDDKHPRKHPEQKIHPAALKGVGLFVTGVRRSARNSKNVPEIPSRSSDVSSGMRRRTQAPSGGSADQLIASKEHVSHGSRAPEGRVSTRSQRERRRTVNKESHTTSSAASGAARRVSSEADRPATSAGTPPVGWVYEAVTNPQDLIPKKAFIIDEDLNDFKCTQENCNKSFRNEELLQSHLKHNHNIHDDRSREPQATISTSDPSGNEHRRPQGRRTRAATGGRPNFEESGEVASDANTENHDISATTVVDTVSQLPPPQTRRERRAISPVNLSQSPSTSSDPSGNEHCRPQGRTTRASTRGRPHSEESGKVASDADTEICDISTTVVIDAVGLLPPPQTRRVLRAISSINLSPSPSTPSEELKRLRGTTAAAARAFKATEAESAKTEEIHPRAPLRPKLEQNRSAYVRATPALGRVKRKVVKAEREAKAEVAPLRRQKLATKPTPVDKANELNTCHGDRNESVLKAENRSQAALGSGSEDRLTVNSCDSSLPPDSKRRSETPEEEDVVHCRCGVIEECGLMMQCDFCFCWQHCICFGLKNKENVPERYVCIACRNARRVVYKQTHQQAAFRAMTDGRVPSLLPGISDNPRRFMNLTEITKTMMNLRKALRGIEIRILRVSQDTNRSLTERREELDAARADAEAIERQMDLCERIIANIDRPVQDQANDPSAFRSTVKRTLEHLKTVQKLTLFKNRKRKKAGNPKRNRVPKPAKPAEGAISTTVVQQA